MSNGKLKKIIKDYRDSVNSIYISILNITMEGTPTVIPSNLKDIKLALQSANKNSYETITNETLGKVIGIRANNMSSIVSNRNSLSGKSAIKLMKAYDLSFETLYSKNEKYVGPIEQHHDYSFIIGTHIPINSDVEAKSYFDKFENATEKLYTDDNKKALITTFNKIIDNGKLVFEIPNKTKTFLGENIVNLYEETVDSLVNREGYFTEYKYFYFFGVRIICNEIGEVDLSSERAVDREYTNELFKVPFVKVYEEKVEEYTISANGQEVIFQKPFNIVTPDGILYTDVIDKKYVDVLVNGKVKMYIIKTKCEYVLDFEDDGEYITLDKYYHIATREGLKYTNRIESNLVSKNSDGAVILNIFSGESHINKLKIFRIQKNLSTKQMAEILGITNDTYSLVERGCQKLSLSVMWKIEHKLGVYLDNIIDIDAYYEKFCKDK